MRITFVCPEPNWTGGCRVLAIYAEQLTQRGHRVVLVIPGKAKRTFRERFGLARRSGHGPGSHFDELTVPIVRARRQDRIESDEVPDADVVVATWWETAEWINEYPSAKGEKAYFIQHHEVHRYLPLDRVYATYRMPLQKIVVAQWLADLMKVEYGDAHVVVVPNSVDHSQFFAPERHKQAVPTVGLMYSSVDWKRFDLAGRVLERVRARIPDMKVVVFGSERPEHPLPNYFEFTFAPPQAELKVLYSSCDVWLTASSSEGFNLPAMEAMACRTPVVATKTGWPAQAIANGVNGYCVEVDDAAALERAVASLLALAPIQWQSVSKEAFNTVRDSNWQEMTRQFENVLISCVQSPARTDRS